MLELLRSGRKSTEPRVRMQIALDACRQGVEPTWRMASCESGLKRFGVAGVVDDVANEGFWRGGLEDGEDWGSWKCGS